MAGLVPAIDALRYVGLRSRFGRSAFHPRSLPGWYARLWSRAQIAAGLDAPRELLPPNDGTDPCYRRRGNAYAAVSRKVGWLTELHLGP
jgi:hypothetical protein